MIPSGWLNDRTGQALAIRRQISAANGTPIRWLVAESEAAGGIQNLFGQRGITQIQIEYLPPFQ